jgi:hypothetical protein
VGPWFNHEHHDQGSFQVAAFGESLVAEAGYSDYYRDPHYLDYFTQAPGHNTVLLDDDPFSQTPYDGRYWRAFQNYPRFTRHVFSTGIDYLAADLGPAYGGALEGFTREYLFLKPNIFIVHDRLQANTPHRYSWLLHLPAGTYATISGSEAVIRGKASAAMITTTQSKSGWSIESNPIPIVDYKDLDKKQVQLRQALRLELPRQTTGDFLVGMRFTMKASEGVALKHVVAPFGEGFSATMAETKIAAIFRSRSGLLASEEISTDGNALAVVQQNGAETIFASQARSLRSNQQLLFSSTAPVQIVLQTTASEDELHVVAAEKTDLRIPARKSVVQVVLDGKLTAARPVGGVMTLNVAEGEHSASIRY